MSATLPRRRSFTAVSTYVFERVMPDAFVLAIALTALVAGAAALFAPLGSFGVIVTAWYTGLFGILGFAFQMILILVTGHVLAHAPPVQRGLRALVSRVTTPNAGVVLTFLVAAVASWINGGHQHGDLPVPDRRAAAARGARGLHQRRQERGPADRGHDAAVSRLRWHHGHHGATGLAEQVSRSFVAAASAHSLPLLGYLASLLITFVVPSGGGHWAVQGPFTIPAAVALHASIPATTMGVAMGEQVANMLQPFWALPVVAIAGIGIQRVPGFTVVTFLVAGIIYGAALWGLT